MPSVFVSVSVYVGLAVAAFAKILVSFAWRRITAPRGRHQHRNRHARAL
jgi:outer membrane protease